MMMVKLATNNKVVNLPKAKTSVKGILRSLNRNVDAHNVSKILAVVEKISPDGSRRIEVCYSRMSPLSARGLLRYGDDLIKEDFNLERF